MWPFKSQKSKAGTSNSSQGDLDRLYSISRRLERRVTDQEMVISILKRDVARIDRANYRDAEAKPVAEGEGPVEGILSPERLLEIYNQR